MALVQNLREDIRAVLDRDPAARSAAEVLLTYPGLHAILMHRLAHALWQAGWRLTARWLSMLARWLTGIEIHPAAVIGRRFFIDHGQGVVIGETAEIGDDVTLYQGVTLGGTTLNQGKRHPTLEDGVIVGAGAKVLGPIRLARGARVGSNAVVLKDVAPGTSVVGIPAKPVGQGQAVTTAAGAAVPIGAFQAYGCSQVDDPIGCVLEILMGEVGRLSARIEELERREGILIEPPVPAVVAAEAGRALQIAANDAKATGCGC